MHLKHYSERLRNNEMLTAAEGEEQIPAIDWFTWSLLINHDVKYVRTNVSVN